MSLSPFFRSRNKRRLLDEQQAAERDCALRIFASDIACRMLVLDKEGQELASFTQNKSANDNETRPILALAIAHLPPEWEKRIGDVQVFIDDAEIAIVDSRQAKLTHFEGRALAEFGKYQFGGKPVAFGSHPYGQTSTQEAEKRLVGYISEDRLSAVLFALGKLARYATFCGPWSLQTLLAETRDEPRAMLAVHGDFSTLAFTNGLAGAVAVRHLPLGTASFAKAYGEEFGLSAEAATTALTARRRLSVGSTWPPDPATPAANTGSHAALAPLLNRIALEVRSTSEYFEFQRLAGRASVMRLTVTGDVIQGFTEWLSDMLDIAVEAAPEKDANMSAEPAVNFLTGMRSGLLKLGNQLYDFAAGRFVPADEASQAAKAAAADRRDLVTKLREFSSQPLSLSSFRGAVAPLALLLVLVAGGWSVENFWLGPVDDQLASSVSLYNGTLAQNVRTGSAASQAVTEPVLWARDILSISGAMPYDMRLTRIVLAAPRPGSLSQLLITGSLPKTGRDNLQLVGKFMTRVSLNNALKRRINGLTFAGAGDDNAVDSPDMQFHLTAKVAP